MLSKYIKNRLFKSFSVYIFSNLFNSAISLILLPVFTHYLTPEDYGTLSLINTTISILTIFIMVGADGSLRRKFYSYKGYRYARYFSSSVFTTIVAFFIVIFISFIGSRWLSSLAQISEKWLLLSAVISFLSILPTILLGQYRVEEKPVAFAIYSNAMTIVNMGLGIFFVILLNMNYEGRGYSLILTNLIFCVISIVILKRRKLFVKSFKVQDMKASLEYGLPIIPHQIGGLIINFSDRYFIANLINIAAAGFYNVGYTIGSIIGKVEGSFTQAFVPFLFQELSKNTNEADRRVVKVSYFFLLGLLCSTLLLYLFSEIVFNYLIDPRYMLGKKYVFWIGIGYFFSGCYKVVSGYIYYMNKTIFLTYLSIFNIALNILLNYFLIVRFGAMGAAFATVISFFLMFLVTFLIVLKLKPMPWLSVIISKY